MHDISVSSHVRVQVPQECGHSIDRYSALAPPHSPSFAHAAHEAERSLQYPVATTDPDPMESRNMGSFIIAMGTACGS